MKLSKINNFLRKFGIVLVVHIDKDIEEPTELYFANWQSYRKKCLDELSKMGQELEAEKCVRSFHSKTCPVGCTSMMAP